MPVSAHHITRRAVLGGGLATTSTLLLAGCGNPSRSEIRTQVLVLGAGLSGLHAAYLLEQAGYETVILEATDEVGGRVRTVSKDLVPGHPELGASGIGAHYSRLIEAASRVGVELVPERKRTESEPDDLAYYVRDAIIRPQEWSGHRLNALTEGPLKEVPLHLLQFMIYGGAQNPLPRGDFTAWQTGNYLAQDISVYDRMKTPALSDDFMRLAFGTNASYGADERDLSMLMGYQSRNLIDSLYSGPGGFTPDARAAKGGNQRLPEAMAAALTSPVLGGDPVVAIDVTDSGVATVTQSGKTYQAQYCICTIPFAALRKINIRAPMPKLQREAINQLGYTPVFQAHYAPTKAFWEDDGLPVNMWTDGEPGRFMAQRNDPAAPDQVTSYVAFVNGYQAIALDALGPEEASRKVLGRLAKLRPATRGALKPLTTWSWSASPYAGGAYAYWKPGQISSFSNEMRAPAGRLYFAGEHTAVQNRGMEGAMESGERVVFEVLEKIIA